MMANARLDIGSDAGDFHWLDRSRQLTTGVLDSLNADRLLGTCSRSKESPPYS
jgi:hypothetical protein